MLYFKCVAIRKKGAENKAG